MLALFAIIFQTPIVLIGLARLGIVNASSLMHYRRHAIFGFFVAGGIAAPDGNPLTMALLALPMYVLYEISIWIILPLERALGPFDGICAVTATARAFYGDFVRTFGNVLFAVSLFVVWGLLTLVGVVVDQGKTRAATFKLRGADRPRDSAPELRQRLSFAVVRRHHRIDLAVAGGLHVQARHPRASAAAASGQASTRFRCTPASTSTAMRTTCVVASRSSSPRAAGGCASASSAASNGASRTRHNWARRGVLVAHIGFVIVAAGTTLYWARGFSGDMAVLTGQAIAQFRKRTR